MVVGVFWVASDTVVEFESDVFVLVYISYNGDFLVCVSFYAICDRFKGAPVKQLSLAWYPLRRAADIVY